MNRKVQEALDRLSQVADRPLSEFRDAVTREVSHITNSELSYLAAMNFDETILTMIGWSQTAMSSCAMINRPLVYRIEDTGLWGDAVRERQAVICNDYPSLEKATKKGYPAGHVELQRHMNLPIFEGNRIVLVIGVGNKRTNYTAQDAQNIEELMLAINEHLQNVIGEATW